MDGVFAEIREHLITGPVGAEVMLRGFGSFTKKETPARSAKTPNGGVSTTPARARIRFRAGKEMKSLPLT